MTRQQHTLRTVTMWPLDFWVPGQGWVSASCLTLKQLKLAIAHADRCGDQHHPVSRWHSGFASAESVGHGALVDFPPGPGDELTEAAVLIAEMVGDGLIAPIHQFRNGGRLKTITELGIAEFEAEERRLASAGGPEE
jgi:hypothetical protein